MAARKGQRGDLRGVARTPSMRKQKGDVLFYDTFSDGGRPTFNHWRQHYAGAGTAGAPVIPHGLTRYPALDSYALALSTASRDDAGTPDSQKGYGSYKNLSRWFTEADAHLISFSGFFTVLAGRTAPSANWGLGMDFQNWNSDDRSFFKVQCRYPTSGSANWYAYDNIADSSTGDPGTGSPIQLPNSDHCTAGINQNKFNWNYVEMTIRLDANGNRGAYHSLQVNQKYFDLTDPAVWPDSAQSGQQNPQGDGNPASSAQHLLDYSGGLNFGVFGAAPATGKGYPFKLYCARLCATVYEAD